MERIVSPSVLSADFLRLGEEMAMLNESAAQWIHLDIMDGVYVPNISYGIPVVKAIRKATDKVLDAHLMIVDPERYINAFADAGADILTVHAEATRHLHRTLQAIKAKGMKAGVSLNPATPLSEIEEVLCDADLVLIMSVNPGFGGQSFIPASMDKVRRLRAMIEERGCPTMIEIDGGVTLENAGALYAAGCDALVAGNTVFSSPNPKETIEKLLKA